MRDRAARTAGLAAAALAIASALTWGSSARAASAGLYGPLDGGKRLAPGRPVRAGRAVATVSFVLRDGSATTTVSPAGAPPVALRAIGTEQPDGSVARVALVAGPVTVLAVSDGGTDGCVEAVALVDVGRPGPEVRDLGSACERERPDARVVAAGRSARLVRGRCAGPAGWGRARARAGAAAGG